MRVIKHQGNLMIEGEAIEVMQKLIKKGIKVDTIIADLPYGTTTCAWDSVIPFEPMWDCINALLKEKGAICLFGCEPFSSALRMSNLKMYKYDWIWHKSSCSNFLIAAYQPRKTYEVISVFSNGAASYSKKGNNMPYYPQMGDKIHNYTKEYKDSDCRKAFSKKSKSTYKLVHKNVGRKYPEAIIYFSSDKNKIHATQKPIDLMTFLVKTYSKEGEVVLDFCAGSFSTCVACLQSNRKFIGIEKDPEIFQKGIERLKEEFNARARQN